MSDRRPSLSMPWLPLVLAGLCCCSGGGGGGLRYDSGGRLIEIEFLGPSGELTSPDADPPRNAPLLQQVVFRFDAAPDPDEVDRQALLVRDSQGFPVPGRYRALGTEVVFTPTLPTVAADAESGSGNGGAGLRPGEIYSVRAAPRLWPEFLVSIDAGLRARFPDAGDPEGLSLSFRTTTQPEDFFRGLNPRRPRLLSSTPSDGSSDVSPMLYTDPDDLFPAPAPFLLRFDAPVHPASFNLESCLLVDLDETSVAPSGLPLGIHVRVLANEIDVAVVEVRPSGILPFAHLLSLEVPVELRGLSEDPDPPGSETSIAATFVTSQGPGEFVRDELREDYTDQDRRDPTAEEIPLGSIAADWDRADSGVLEAAIVVDGFGELGRFIPAPPGSSEPNRIIYLDSGRQALPLLDGSTPDVAPGTEVVGGVFSFTEIDIPKGVIVRVVGTNPLVLSATESVRIAGEFQMEGGAGNDDFTIDSAVFSMPGGKPGPGGGRGGEGHPVIYRGGIVNVYNLVDPPSGGRGFGPFDRERLGGFGGQCGILDHADSDGEYTTDAEISCGESGDGHNNGYKGPGGGGGSYLVEGIRPRHGVGNVIVDGLGNYIVRTPEDSKNHDQLAAGAAGTRPFSDADPDNDFVGPRGELQEIRGGQGGGSGGSVTDSYYCGIWCHHDADSTNDAVCQAEFFDPPTWPDSAGDARGGGGGGGGGALVIRSMAKIELERGARLLCHGGSGGGGEQQSCSNWGGCGAGGAGGLVSLQAIQDIVVRDGAVIDVAGGPGKYATNHLGWLNSKSACAGSRDPQHRGSGGDGGHGLIQLQLRPGERASVGSGAHLTEGAWVDPLNQRNPADFSSVSIGVSRWYDMGRTIAREPVGTNPVYSFRGTHPVTGLVLTDEAGDLLDPGQSDVECDYLGQLDPLRPGEYLEGQEPRADHVPPSATVRVEFQSAAAIAPGSKETDPATYSPWKADVSALSGAQFLRYRVTFDTTADGAELGPLTPRPAVQSMRVRTSF